MKRLVPLMLVAGLTACASNPPTPETFCTQLGEKEYCGRGGCWRECLKKAVGCADPLVLDQEPNGGKLFCRLDTKTSGPLQLQQ